MRLTDHNTYIKVAYERKSKKRVKTVLLHLISHHHNTVAKIKRFNMEIKRQIMKTLISKGPTKEIIQ